MRKVSGLPSGAVLGFRQRAVRRAAAQVVSVLRSDETLRLDLSGRAAWRVHEQQQQQQRHRCEAGARPDAHLEGTAAGQLGGVRVLRRGDRRTARRQSSGWHEVLPRHDPGRVHQRRVHGEFHFIQCWSRPLFNFGITRDEWETLWIDQHLLIVYDKQTLDVSQLSLVSTISYFYTVEFDLESYSDVTDRLKFFLQLLRISNQNSYVTNNKKNIF